MKRIAAIAGMLFLAGAAGFSGVTPAAADCTCRSNGGETPEGQTACIRTSGGPTLARCEKFLNNTSWKMLNQPCPTAALQPIGSPADPAMWAAVSG